MAVPEPKQLDTIPKRKLEPAHPIEQTVSENPAPRGGNGSIGNERQQVENDKPKRPRLEVFVIGNDSDAEEAELPNTDFMHSETTERSLGLDHNN